jgi:hypothetical protein
MSFALCSDISIGKYKSIKPNMVKINRSIYEYVDRAILKLPVTARVEHRDKIIVQKVEVANQFIEGDKVFIKLGYNGNLRDEFIGFVSRVNFTSPVEIECEGYSYQLRKKTYLKTFVNVQLIDVLKYLISGTDIVLDKNIPSFKIDKIIFKNATGTEALELIKKVSDNTIRIFFTGNILYAGLLYLNPNPKEDIKYKMRWNVIKDGNLKLRRAKNNIVQVHYIGKKKDGSNVLCKAGKITASDTKVISSHAVTDQSTLKSMADAKLKTLSFDGYEGNITAFGIPYCEPGNAAKLIDEKYPAREGRYIIESTEVVYGMSGFRRVVGISFKL